MGHNHHTSEEVTWPEEPKKNLLGSCLNRPTVALETYIFFLFQALNASFNIIIIGNICKQNYILNSKNEEFKRLLSDILQTLAETVHKLCKSPK